MSVTVNLQGDGPAEPIEIEIPDEFAGPEGMRRALAETEEVEDDEDAGV